MDYPWVRFWDEGRVESGDVMWDFGEVGEVGLEVVFGGAVGWAEAGEISGGCPFLCVGKDVFYGLTFGVQDASVFFEEEVELGRESGVHVDDVGEFPDLLIM